MSLTEATREIMRDVCKLRDHFRQRRDAYAHGSAMWHFNDGRFHAMREFAITLREGETAEAMFDREKLHGQTPCP